MSDEVKKYERVYYPISESAASNAKRMNSFSDYKAGSATADYRATADEAYDLAEERINSGLTPENAETVWYLATKYAKKMAAWTNAENSNSASVPSIMISGGSNFPVRRKEKQNARSAKLWDEYEYIQGLLERIRNIARSNAIKSNDPNAVELLEAKLERLIDSQEEMKAQNAHWRKHGTMKGYDDWTDEQAAKQDKYLAERRWGDPKSVPFASYSLSNNNQNIASVKQRIEQIRRNKAIAAAGGMKYETGGICEVKEDEAAMRIRLIFPDKPDNETRTVLKGNGFVWSPSAGAWQRQLNNSGRYAVKCVLEKLVPMSESGADKQDGKIKVLVRRVGQEPTVESIDNTLEAQQKIVGGYIEMPYNPELSKDLKIVINEEGKFADDPKPNVFWGDHDVIYGDILFVNVDENSGETISLTPEQIDEAKKWIINNDASGFDGADAMDLATTEVYTFDNPDDFLEALTGKGSEM